MIIWGFRSRSKPLGQRMVACPNCHRDAMTAAVQSRRWFTLFFIPIFPVQATKTIAVCGLCGYKYLVDPQQAAQLYGTAKAPAPQVQPPVQA